MDKLYLKTAMYLEEREKKEILKPFARFRFLSARVTIFKRAIKRKLKTAEKLE